MKKKARAALLVKMHDARRHWPLQAVVGDSSDSSTDATPMAATVGVEASSAELPVNASSAADGSLLVLAAEASLLVPAADDVSLPSVAFALVNNEATAQSTLPATPVEAHAAMAMDADARPATAHAVTTTLPPSTAFYSTVDADTREYSRSHPISRAREAMAHRSSFREPLRRDFTNLTGTTIAPGTATIEPPSMLYSRGGFPSRFNGSRMVLAVSEGPRSG
ncbi:hypothetical protein CAOG_010101 [Capsaspora owczarzaki ATCC 30864]|uniref:Uncharacterized protein n=1 Tax=Capsaspora owczarzaki (strain ATCC 30864) TaxID=595528 RepID=A0A0D2WX53_CAPO3|nr:hypothetical protein CAOG_010101 [Capsaspora owczarzaki ATCC 30864]